MWPSKNKYVLPLSSLHFPSISFPLLFLPIPLLSSALRSFPLLSFPFTCFLLALIYFPLLSFPLLFLPRYVSALTTPARMSPVDFHSSSLPQQVPTFQITTPNASHALSLPPAVGSYSPGDDQPLLRRPRPARNPYHSEGTGSLPSSPYRLADDEDYETTQEYMSSRERPKKSGSGRRWHRRSHLNGHVSQRAKGPRDYSSQSCLSDSEWEEDEEEEEMGELGHGESTPFLSMQNMSMNNEPATIYRPNDMRTYSSTARSTSRSNTHTNKLSQSRSKPDNAPL